MNQRIKVITMTLVIFICFLPYRFACGQPQKEKEMKNTTMKLVRLLKNCDSVSVLNLFEQQKEKDERRDDIKDDCLLFDRLTKKYGIPLADSLILSKAENGANIAVAPIMNTNDSTFRIKKCVLLVVFYPDQFLTNPQKFLYYSLITEPLYPKKNKIFEKPKIPPIQKK